MKKIKSWILLVVGILMLIPVAITYVPYLMEHGMYEYELTFLSNLITGVVFIVGGLYGLIKEKQLPQPVYFNSVVLVQLVFLICMAFLAEFNFKGSYLFLHITNPILATIVFFLCTTPEDHTKGKTVLSALIFPLVYLVYVIIYGYASGYWIYGIVNIPDRGLLFVLSVIAASALGIVALACVQYGLSRLLYRKMHE